MEAEEDMTDQPGPVRIDLASQRSEPYKKLAAAVVTARHMNSSANNENEDSFLISLVQSVVEALVYVGDSINNQTQTSIQIYQNQMVQETQRYAEVPEDRSKDSGRVWTPK